METNLAESLTLKGLYPETQWHTNPQLAGWWAATPCTCIDCSTTFTAPAALIGGMNVRGEFRCLSCSWEKYTDKAKFVAFWRRQPSIPKLLLPILEKIENGLTSIQK